MTSNKMTKLSFKTEATATTFAQNSELNQIYE